MTSSTTLLEPTAWDIKDRSRPVSMPTRNLANKAVTKETKLLFLQHSGQNPTTCNPLRSTDGTRALRAIQNAKIEGNLKEAVIKEYAFAIAALHSGDEVSLQKHQEAMVELLPQEDSCHSVLRDLIFAGIEAERQPGLLARWPSPHHASCRTDGNIVHFS